ncbi:hypothetical protein J6590_020320 [Homalodisca vitripennis]|nr:hypothetical protein J6590_020320 [Homalodisca vitripennis]
MSGLSRSQRLPARYQASDSSKALSRASGGRRSARGVRRTSTTCNLAHPLHSRARPELGRSELRGVRYYSSCAENVDQGRCDGPQRGPAGVEDGRMDLPGTIGLYGDEVRSHLAVCFTGVEDGRMDLPGTIGLYGGEVRSHLAVCFTGVEDGRMDLPGTLGMYGDEVRSHLAVCFTGVEDGRMDPPGTLGLYGGAVRSHSSSSSSASPPHGAATLIVPHPLAASKDQHHVVTHNGSGRKYQCKMCPQVEKAMWADVNHASRGLNCALQYDLGSVQQGR